MFSPSSSCRCFGTFNVVIIVAPPSCVSGPFGGLQLRRWCMDCPRPRHRPMVLVLMMIHNIAKSK